MALCYGVSKGTKSPNAGPQFRRLPRQHRHNNLTKPRTNQWKSKDKSVEVKVDRAVSPSGTGLPKTRIEALSDGVFAIAMTLMVFNIKVPDIPSELVHARLAHDVLGLWPKFLVYAISFVMLGVYWVGHHNQYHYIRRTDRPVLWINIFFLMGVSLIPFSTSLLGQYPEERAALTAYGLNLIMTGGFLYAHWWYATRHHRLVESDIHPEVVRLAKHRIAVGLVVSATAVCLSLVSTTLSLALFALIPILYLLPGRIDRHWLRSSPNSGQ
jgi:uncharacterized membrane protein